MPHSTAGLRKPRWQIPWKPFGKRTCSSHVADVPDDETHEALDQGLSGWSCTLVSMKYVEDWIWVRIRP